MAKGSIRVVLSSRAERMLLTHAEFLARVSPSASRKFIAEFKKAAQSIADNPNQFPFISPSGLPQGLYRKCLFHGRYQIVYLVNKDVVYFDSVLDCRQDNDLSVFSQN